MKYYPLLQVKCGLNKEPLEIKYKNQLLQVAALLEYWQDTGCWWDGESEKAFYRLIFEDRSIREVFYDLAEEQWYLYKTYD